MLREAGGVSSKTLISWTDSTWNPTVGCSRVSAGCANCYAEKFAHGGRNGPGPALGGLTRESGGWNGLVRMNPKALELPLRWRKPRRIFVNSMSDLFHENLSDEQIDQVFAVMALAPQHTFQVLTKRPERMRAYMTDPATPGRVACAADRIQVSGHGHGGPSASEWPLGNLWAGTSVEDQATADERIPLLLQTPAAQRFASYEPALGPVDFTSLTVARSDGREQWNALDRFEASDAEPGSPKTVLDWIIVGGESGPNARPFDIAWARTIVEQCKEAGVAVFVKQLGAWSYSSNADDWIGRLLTGPHSTGRGLETKMRVHFRARKADDPSEWPEDLRVQEFPA